MNQTKIYFLWTAHSKYRTPPTHTHTHNSNIYMDGREKEKKKRKKEAQYISNVIVCLLDIYGSAKFKILFL